MDILNMNSKELKELAKNNNVKNWWTMKKSDLINSLLELGENGVDIEPDPKIVSIESEPRNLVITSYHSPKENKIGVRSANKQTNGIYYGNDEEEFILYTKSEIEDMSLNSDPSDFGYEEVMTLDEIKKLTTKYKINENIIYMKFYIDENDFRGLKNEMIETKLKEEAKSYGITLLSDEHFISLIKYANDKTYNELIEEGKQGIEKADKIKAPIENKDYEKMTHKINLINGKNKTDDIILEEIEAISDKNEIILNTDEIQKLLKIVKSKIKVDEKIIYAIKDEKIHVIKDIGQINDLWYKYRDLGYKQIKTITYNKAFGFKENKNIRHQKVIDFIIKNANQDLKIKHETFNKE